MDNPNTGASHVPPQIVVKLNPEERIALTAVIETLKNPHRPSPSISEGVRAAILATAARAARVA